MASERPIVLGSPFAVSDARLASLLDIAADGIIVIDERATILVFNKACEAMFGYGSEEAIGCNVSMLMPLPRSRADQRDFLSEIRGRAARQDSTPKSREIVARRKDGTLFPLEVSIADAGAGNARQFIAILRDITARKDVERRFTELQSDLFHVTRVSALDELGLTLAHELNQPLTAITLYLQAVGRELRATVSPDARAHVILEKARNEADRAGSIIQRLRRLAEKRAPDRRSIDLNAVVDDAVDLTLIGHDPSVRVRRSYQPGLPAVEVDQVQIQQVVVNLVRNAFDAVRNRIGAEIVVATGVDDRCALFSVADNGPEIGADQFNDLFQAFKTGKRNGMGLGLAISRSIVQSHGGELVVEPGGSGRGACFVVRLPLPEVRELSPSVLSGRSEGGRHLA